MYVHIGVFSYITKKNHMTDRHIVREPVVPEKYQVFPLTKRHSACYPMIGIFS